MQGGTSDDNQVAPSKHVIFIKMASPRMVSRCYGSRRYACISSHAGLSWPRTGLPQCVPVTPIITLSSADLS